MTVHQNWVWKNRETKYVILVCFKGNSFSPINLWFVKTNKVWPRTIESLRVLWIILNEITKAKSPRTMRINLDSLALSLEVIHWPSMIVDFVSRIFFLSMKQEFAPESKRAWSKARCHLEALSSTSLQKAYELLWLITKGMEIWTNDLLEQYLQPQPLRYIIPM